MLCATFLCLSDPLMLLYTLHYVSLCQLLKLNDDDDDDDDKYLYSRQKAREL